MKLSIEIKSNNADVVDAPESFVCYALDNIQRKIEYGCESGAVLDGNGNAVGHWSIEYDED